MARSMTLPDFLDQKQIESALALYKKFKGTGRVATEIAEQIIEPAKAEIERKLGQEVDSKFMAYACEHTFNALGY